MDDIVRTHLRHKNSLAAYLLYLASVFGVIGLLFNVHHYRFIFSIDIAVYIILALIAFLIHRGFIFARFLYAVIAIVWYLAAIFFLPERFGHYIDVYVLFMQLILTFYAFFILFIRSKVKRH